MAIIESITVPLDPEIVKVQEETAANAYQVAYSQVTFNRQAGYQQTSDPIFMQYQRGEATEQEWLDAVQAVKDANPHPVKEESAVTEENTPTADIALE